VNAQRVNGGCYQKEPAPTVLNGINFKVGFIFSSQPPFRIIRKLMRHVETPHSHEKYETNKDLSHIGHHSFVTAFRADSMPRISGLML
jgi:hypothetical protein